MSKILTVIATLCNGNRNNKGTQPKRGAAVQKAFTSNYSAQSFADILAVYMEGGTVGK